MPDFFSGSTSAQRKVNRIASGLTSVNYASNLIQSPETSTQDSLLLVPGINFFNYTYNVFRAGSPVSERLQGLFFALLNLAIWWLNLAIRLNQEGDEHANKAMQAASTVLQIAYIASYLAVFGAGEAVKEPTTTAPALTV